VPVLLKLLDYVELEVFTGTFSVLSAVEVYDFMSVGLGKLSVCRATGLDGF
jgi:hypothetical protein